MYRINENNFKRSGLKFDHFSAKIIDVEQQFVEGYGFVAVTVKKLKNCIQE